jgi:drug/metabolite transporter superfamily protein YnfA
MGNVVALLFLTVAALLEAGGDALVRAGLHAPSSLQKISFLVGGALVLFAYGVTVNTPSWDFGRLSGVYVTLFFLAAQAINLFAFGVQPSLPIFIGGALIISGGLIITFWHQPN